MDGMHERFESNQLLLLMYAHACSSRCSIPSHSISFRSISFRFIPFHSISFRLELSLLLLLLLGLLFETSRNEFVRVHPLVDGRLDTGDLGSGQRFGRFRRDAFFVRSIRQIVDDLLDEHLLLEHHGHLLHLGGPRCCGSSTTGRHHVASPSESSGVVGRVGSFSTSVRIVAAAAAAAASTEPACHFGTIVIVIVIVR